MSTIEKSSESTLNVSEVSSTSTHKFIDTSSSMNISESALHVIGNSIPKETQSAVNISSSVIKIKTKYRFNGDVSETSEDIEYKVDRNRSGNDTEFIVLEVKDSETLSKSHKVTVEISDRSLKSINRFKYQNSVEELHEGIDYVVNSATIIKVQDRLERIYEKIVTKIVRYRVGVVPITPIPLKFFKASGKSFNSNIIDTVNTTELCQIYSRYTQPKFPVQTFNGLISEPSSIGFQKASGKSLTSKIINTQANNLDVLVKKQLYAIDHHTYFYDFGTLIVSGKAFVWTGFNGSRETLTVSKLAVPPFLGISLDGIAIGDTVNPYGGFNFTVIAYPDRGDSIVYDFFTIHFSNGQELQIWVKILRIADFSLAFSPDKNSYNETLYFTTAVFSSFNKTESRKPLQSRGKYKCSYTITLTGQEKKKTLEHMVHHSLASFIKQPLWAQAVKITGTVIDSTRVPCEPTGNTTLEVGMDVAIWDVNQVISSVFKLTAVGPDYVELHRPTMAVEGDYIVPIKKMKLAKTVNIDDINSTTFKFSISAEEF